MSDMHRMMNVSLNTTTLLTWLSALFAAPPSAELVAVHRRGAANHLLEELNQHAEFAPGIKLMRAALDKHANDETVANELGWKYGLLFDGIGGPGTVPPYESVFRPGAAWRLFQEPFSEMNAMLGEHRLSICSNTAPADHLSIELALAAHLAAVDDPSFKNMSKRLAGWIPGFAARCIEADDGGFWGGAARVLAAAISHVSSHPEAIDAKEKAV